MSWTGDLKNYQERKTIIYTKKFTCSYYRFETQQGKIMIHSKNIDLFFTKLNLLNVKYGQYSWKTTCWFNQIMTFATLLPRFRSNNSSMDSNHLSIIMPLNILDKQKKNKLN